ncbi:MBL fold metallo-hydrolase [Chloroflexi bacterium TSY]|nr:MBL fold metallo-hydrolase [Chloroflexi bacterium TSY]
MKKYLFLILLSTILMLAGCVMVQPEMAQANSTERMENTETDSEQTEGDASDNQETSVAFQMPEPILTELSDGVYSYFGLFYNSLVVVTDEGVLITDPSNAFRAQMLKDAIAELTDQPVTHIVLTHEHYDHTGGTEVFPDAEVICHENCAEIFALDLYGLVPEQVDTQFDTFLSIELGDKVIELHHMGPGDGVATTVIYLPEQQIFASADLYDPGTITNANFMDDKNMLGVRHILNEVSTWDIKHAINAHSAGTDPQDIVEAATYYNDLYEAVDAVLQPIIEQGGLGAAFGALDTLHEQVSLPQYEEWANYDSSFAKHVFRMAQALIHGG